MMERKIASSTSPLGGRGNVVENGASETLQHFVVAQMSIGTVSHAHVVLKAKKAVRHLNCSERNSHSRGKRRCGLMGQSFLLDPPTV